MAKLLARVGGTPTEAPTESSPKNREAGPLLQKTFQKELEQRDEEFKTGPYVPRAAPERMEDLKALRDVANATARAAIDSSRRKKNSSAAIGWVIGSGVCVVVGGMFFKLSTSPMSANFLGAVICLGGCVYCIRKAMLLRNSAGKKVRREVPATEDWSVQDSSGTPLEDSNE
ncbi:MAG: hypothetical protein R3B96_00840 [Pirellulaceae bacterium]